jgi:hypothetical protein
MVDQAFFQLGLNQWVLMLGDLMDGCQKKKSGRHELPTKSGPTGTQRPTPSIIFDNFSCNKHPTSSFITSALSQRSALFFAADKLDSTAISIRVILNL